MFIVMNVLYLFQVIFSGSSIAVYVSFNMPHKEKVMLILFGPFFFWNHKFTPLCSISDTICAMGYDF